MSKSVLNIILVLLLFAISDAKAQQVPFYNHYMTNPVVYNPAFAGLDDNLNIYLTRGQRYMGVGTGAVENTLSLEGKFFIPNSGFGLFVGHQSAGPLNQLSVKMDYAYHVKFGEEHSLGLGVSVGYLENRLRTDQFNILHEQDPFLLGMRNFKPSFDLNAGLLYRFNHLRVGFSIPQIIGNKVKFSDEKTRGYYTLARHMLATASYDFIFPSMEDVTLTPHALLRFVPGAPMQYDFALQVAYKNIGWFSTTYKSDYAVQFNLGFHILKQLHVGYSYEWVVGSAKNYYSGVNHEFLLGYSFNMKKPEVQIRVETQKVEVPDSSVIKENEELRRQLKAKEDLERRLREELALKKEIEAEESINKVDTVYEEEIDRSSVVSSFDNQTFINVDGTDAPHGYYVVVGVYSDMNNLRNSMENLRATYPDVYYIINTEKHNYNYIIIKYTLNLNEALKTWRDYANSTGDKVWILDYK
ncbi:MAG: PorP/SprF family type IX secretion system membrane protein [Brumimicrobium sp.]